MTKPSRQQGGMLLSVHLDHPTDLLSLEPRMLLSADGIDSASFGTPTDHSHAVGCGCAGCCAIEAEFDADLFASEAFDSGPDEAAEPSAIDELFVTTTGSTSETFNLHSNPGATKVIYLDFNGHTTRNTIWNNTYGSTITTPRYDIDGNTGSFSTEELNRIQNIWLRVAEDFIPFNVDVTTQDPGVDNLTNDGDGRYGIRVVIGGDSRDWYTGGGGVAYNGTFDSNSDTPAFVFEDNLANGAEAYVAQAISHEVGHTLGLSHDGDGSSAYYAGHGSGETSWAPIMGLGYQLSVTQWSRGEYSGASNKQDDLAIITSGNGFGYRADDHGSTTGSASMLGLSGTDVADSGIIERNTDYDVFAFTTGAGTITLDVNTLSIGANLDVKAQLLNANGSVIATSNPSGNLNASITKTVSAGNYFLRIEGTGNANPSTNGYSDYGSLGQYAITGTIVDSGPPSSGDEPVISIGNATVNESDGTVALTLTLSEPSSDYVSVYATTANGSAKSGSDYTATSQQLTFSPGKTTRKIYVPIVNDSSDESNETFTVKLSNADGGTIGDGSGTATIIDDDNAPPANEPALSINNVTVGENDGDAAFTITLSEPSDNYVSVTVTTANGSAQAGGDYTATSQRITFSPGKTTRKVYVPIADDSNDESNETFTAVLSDASGATIDDASGTATIIDNDDAPPANEPAISIDNVIVNESDGTAAITLTLSEPASDYVSVTATTANGSAKAGSDYTAMSQRITFSPGKTKRKIYVSIKNDSIEESNEAFTIKLTDPNGATIADGSGTATIIDDDENAQPSVSIDNVTVNEDDGTATFTLTLSEPASDYVSVAATTSNGSAKAGSDYTANFQRLTFNPGKTTRKFTVVINNDSIEESNESFGVTLSDPSGVTIADGSGTATIIDNDQTPDTGTTVSIANATVDEDAGTVAITITLSEPSDDYVSVTVATANGSAKAGSDYSATSKRITFSPGKTTRKIYVSLIDDSSDESNESFTVNLSDVSGAVIADGSGSVTIIDNDDDSQPSGDPTLSIANVSVSENDGSAAFTITLSEPSDDYVSVTVATANGSAKASGDYTATSERITFSPGKTTRKVYVPIVNDSNTEPNETFTAKLSDASGATIDDGSGTATIIDDDNSQPSGEPALSINNTAASEGDGSAAFTITLSEPSDDYVSVTVTTANGSAKAGGDYTAKTQRITFSPGKTTRKFFVSIINDSNTEPNETFTAKLSDANGATIADGSGTATILENSNILAAVPHAIPAPGDPIVPADHDDDHNHGHSAAVQAIRDVLRGDAKRVLDIFKMI